MIKETIVEAGYCGDTGPERFDFDDCYFNHFFAGDAFDQNGLLINRYKISTISEDKVLEYYDYYTRDPSRAVLRLADRIETPLKNHTKDDVLIGRRVRIEIALKVFFGMHGYPEPCERHIPRGFLILEEYMRKLKHLGG